MICKRELFNMTSYAHRSFTHLVTLQAEYADSTTSSILQPEILTIHISSKEAPNFSELETLGLTD